MNILLLPLMLIALCVASPANTLADARLTKTNNFETEQWLTLKMSSRSVVGGDAIFTISTTIQQLPNGGYLLSAKGKSDRLPISQRLITKTEANKIREVALSYIRKAITETTEDTTDRNASMSMQIVVPREDYTPLDNSSPRFFQSGPTSFVGSNFSTETTTGAKFHNFLIDIRTRPLHSLKDSK